MTELKPYEPPEITRLPFIAYTKHHPREITPVAHIDDDFDAAALVERFGTPLYVISEGRLRQEFRSFLDAFTDTDLDTRVAYSVKTNYLPAVCSILKEEGAWAEVVSGMEYGLIRSLGFSASQVIFNGPHKTRNEVERALAEGAIVNIDNFDELSLVEELVKGLPSPARIGIRISFRFKAIGWTKFGFNDDDGDSHKALERIAKNTNLRLELLHSHCGTFVLTEELYARATDRLIRLAKRARDLNLEPTMVDLGGGFPSSNNLRPEYDFPGGSSRSGNFWFPYAEEICSRLQKARSLFGGKPTLVLEPGRAVVDSSTQLLCTVVATKVVEGQTPAVIVDAGVNLVPTACFYDHGLTRAAGVDGIRPGHHRAIDIYGPLCMQTDRLREQALLPPLEVGDVLAISHVGAYCHTQSSQFIQTRPATVLLGPDGPEVIRRRETWRDVFALDTLPERLRGDGCCF
jgi:diaminopimelate decarboxylase